MYLLIPVELCTWALKNKFVRPFQVYVLLKSMCKGKMIITNSHIRRVRETLVLKSARAVKNNLSILQRRDWVGYNPASGYYFIRGFKNIPIARNFKCSTGAEFNTSEIKHFKAFIAGAVMGYLVSQQKRMKWLSERKKSRSKHLSHHSFSYPCIGNKALAKLLNISSSTASGLKQLARKADYISIKKHYTETGYSRNYLSAYRRMDEDNQHKIIVKNNKVVIQGIDEVNSLIRFKHLRHWKKSDTYISP